MIATVLRVIAAVLFFLLALKVFRGADDIFRVETVAAGLFVTSFIGFDDFAARSRSRS